MNIQRISVEIGRIKSDGWCCSIDFDSGTETKKIDLEIEASPQELREAVVSEAWRQGIDIEADDVVLDPEANPTYAFWDDWYV